MDYISCLLCVDDEKKFVQMANYLRENQYELEEAGINIISVLFLKSDIRIMYNEDEVKEFRTGKRFIIISGEREKIKKSIIFKNVPDLMVETGIYPINAFPSEILENYNGLAYQISFQEYIGVKVNAMTKLYEEKKQEWEMKKQLTFKQKVQNFKEKLRLGL